MKKLNKLACLLVSIMMFAATFAVTTTAFAQEATTETVTYSAKTYVPEKSDFVNYWGGVDNLSEENGGGIFTFAHSAFTVPMEGKNIKMNTLFKLLSKKAVAEGGDNVDGWVTYSFSTQPSGDKDNSFPYYGGSGNGYFLHITNYSGTTAPNCVEVQFVKMQNNETSLVSSFFLDNALNVPVTLSLAKGESTYSLTFTKMTDDGTVLKKVDGLELDESLFINAKGQTFFSTAIYEGAGCDGNHWEHRGLAVFSAEVYTVDLAQAIVTLEATEYEYDETINAYKPEVTVVNGATTLTENTDYFVTYKNNKAVGTAEAVITYIGEYTGNASKTVTFEIKENETEQPTTSEPTSTPETPEDPATSEDNGCAGGIGVSTFASVLGFAVLLVAKKRR